MVPDAGDTAANKTHKASASWRACLFERADNEEVRSFQRLMKPVDGIGKMGVSGNENGGFNGVLRGGL